jgi:putative oxidoreductase
MIFGSYTDIASVFLRLAVGTLFMIHGYPKLTSQREGSWMKNLGMPTAMVPFAGTVEFFGGLALLLGILTPIIAFLATLWMLSTIWFARIKLKKKYMGGYELDVTLLLAALALAFLGPGSLSIDQLIGL